MKNRKLPSSADLFQRYFAPWYPSTAPAPTATRPDLFIMTETNSQTLSLEQLQYLSPELLEAAQDQIAAMTKAGLEDFNEIVEFEALDVDVINAVLENYERKDVMELLAESSPEEFSNPYLVTVCVFGAMLGELFLQEEGFGWLYGFPYYHSIIVHPPTGLAIPVFDWMIKRFSEDAIKVNLTEKFEYALEVVAQRSGEKG